MIKIKGFYVSIGFLVFVSLLAFISRTFDLSMITTGNPQNLNSYYWEMPGDRDTFLIKGDSFEEAMDALQYFDFDYYTYEKRAEKYRDFYVLYQHGDDYYMNLYLELNEPQRDVFELYVPDTETFYYMQNSEPASDLYLKDYGRLQVIGAATLKPLVNSRNTTDHPTKITYHLKTTANVSWILTEDRWGEATRETKIIFKRDENNEMRNIMEDINDEKLNQRL